MNIIKGQNFYLEIFITKIDGSFATGLVVNYSIYNSATNILIDSGTLTEIGNGVYQKIAVINTVGQYRIIYHTPAEYSDEIETIAVQEQFAKETTLLTIQTAVELVKQAEFGRWKLIDNQMRLYKEDNVTEIARFNLFDESGSPSVINVTERVRI